MTHPTLYGSRNFDHMKFVHEADFLIDLFLTHGDLSALDVEQKNEIENLVALRIKNDAHRRAIMIDKTLTAYTKKSSLMREAEHYKKQAQLLESRQAITQLNAGVSFLQSHLNLNLTELSGYSDTVYRRSAENTGETRFMDSDKLFDMIEFLFQNFPDKKDTTEFIVSCLNHKKLSSFLSFLSNENYREFIELNFQLSSSQKAQLFEEKTRGVYHVIDANAEIYATLQNHVLLNQSVEEKSIKNSIILRSLLFKAEDLSYEKRREFESDVVSLVSLIDFLKKIKSENTHSAIEPQTVERVVGCYQMRMVMELSNWKTLCTEKGVKSLIKILESHKNIERLLKAGAALFSVNQSVEDMKKSLPLAFFDWIKSSYKLTAQSSAELKKEYESLDVNSIILSHTYKSKYKIDSPEFIKIEKVLLQLQVMLSSDAPVHGRALIKKPNSHKI